MSFPVRWCTLDETSKRASDEGKTTAFGFQQQHHRPVPLRCSAFHHLDKTLDRRCVVAAESCLPKIYALHSKVLAEIARANLSITCCCTVSYWPPVPKSLVSGTLRYATAILTAIFLNSLHPPKIVRQFSQALLHGVRTHETRWPPFKSHSRLSGSVPFFKPEVI